ncbi:MAG: TIR domain-containing protein [Burkholderiaceae bacterium]|nr:TIR domain-containing protein [Burkholderiaceae bacterium]
MKRCAAQTNSGRRCLNKPMADGEFCSVHQDQVSGGKAVAIGLGAAIGHAVLPGLGGAILGSVAGHFVRSLIQGESMSKTRVFVSFDFDNDRVLKDFILGQAKLADSPFEVIDHSLKEAAPEDDWERKAQAAIGKSDIVLVMVGANTYRAQGVLKEIAMARASDVKIVQIIGYKDGDYTSVPNAGRLYAWNWDNLKKLLS